MCMASPVRYAEVKRLLEQTGWTHIRTTGSHFVWSKPGIGIYPIPVHGGKVKAHYVRQIEKLNRQAGQ